jgi:hypothetical protein
MTPPTAHTLLATLVALQIGEALYGLDFLRCSSLWAAIGNSPNKIFGLKQPIAESSHNDCAARRGSRGNKNHLKLQLF